MPAAPRLTPHAFHFECNWTTDCLELSLASLQSAGRVESYDLELPVSGIVAMQGRIICLYIAPKIVLEGVVVTPHNLLDVCVQRDHRPVRGIEKQHEQLSTIIWRFPVLCFNPRCLSAVGVSVRCSVGDVEVVLQSDCKPDHRCPRPCCTPHGARQGCPKANGSQPTRCVRTGDI